MKSKLSLLVLGVVVVFAAAVPSAAAPLSSPCAPGAAYNPACDVDQNGTINITDIQLTAGHWNQTGTFTSDNNHDHLGQTWTGAENPLKIQGAFGPPDYAPLILSNSGGPGLRINAGGGSGVWVESAGNSGLLVDAAADDGVHVCSTGSASGCTSNTTNDGVDIGNAQHYGVRVDSAGVSGIYVGSAGNYGVYVGSAGANGVNVASAGATGVYVASADFHGVVVNSAVYDGVNVASAGNIGVYANTSQASGQWGFYTPDRIFGTIGMFSALSLVVQVTGPDSLTPGDLVAAAGRADPLPGSTASMPLVRLADGAFTNVVGVVESRLALTQQPSRAHPAESATPAEARPAELRNADGPAQAGDYVAITVLGAAQVKVDGATPIAAGQRLTIAANGRTRPLGTIKVQLAGGEGTADMAESAPVIGVALDAPDKNGMVWVLVNPQ